jgi:hypothetical protein
MMSQIIDRPSVREDIDPAVGMPPSLDVQSLSESDISNSSPLPTTTARKSRGGSDRTSMAYVPGGTRTASPPTTLLLERRAEVVPIWHDRAWLRARLPTSVNAS